MNAASRVRKARTALLLQQPFFGTLAVGLALKIDNDPALTCATDGQSLLFNPGWVSTVDDQELKSAITEMVLHCALRHPLRRNGRNAELWNEACDQAVFATMQRSGIALRSRCRVNPEFASKPAEAIYRLLRQKPPAPSSGQQKRPSQAGSKEQPKSLPPPTGKGAASNTGASPVPPPPTASPDSGVDRITATPSDASTQPGSGHVPNQAGEVRDPPPGTDKHVAEAIMARAIQRASKSAKRMGYLPAELQAEIQEMLRVRQDWRAHLSLWMQQITNTDYTWKHPNRRYLALGMYLPSLTVPALGPIVFGVDTSGSISQTELNEAADEATAVCDQVLPEKMHVVYCDAEVQGVDTFERGDTLTFVRKGGGGTAFRPVFDWATALEEPPAGLIYFTDGHGPFPEAAPDFPVLWLIKGSVVPPWGEFVRID